MDLDTLRLLRQIDAQNAERYEFPDGFDWSAEIEQVRALAPVVERLTGRSFQVLDTQDATYLADLWTYDVITPPQQHTHLISVLTIRFSNFGRLFTTWAVSSTPLPSEVVKLVIDAVRERGYRYIDDSALDAKYTGVNPHLRSLNWRSRFFDYL